MVEAIEQLFRNTLNPDAQKRKESEEQLQKLISNKNFIYSLPSSFMKSSDPIIRQVSATFFKNAVIDDIQINIVQFAAQDPLNSAIYGEIIKQHVAKGKDLNQEFIELCRQSENNKTNSDTALLILNAYAELDRSRFGNSGVTNLMGNIDLNLFFERMKNCEKFRSTISKIYDNFALSPQFKDPNFIQKVVNFSLNFNDKDSATLLLRISVRAIKEDINFEPAKNDQKITNFFFNLKGFDQFKAEYFTFYVQSENINSEQKQQYFKSLIQTLIIPNLSYKDLDPIEDLKLKYSFSDDTHNACSLLFTEIVKISHEQDAIINFVKSLFLSQDPKDRYIAISLFSNIDQLLQNKSSYKEFINYIHKLLTDPEKYVQSQALYALQFIEASVFENSISEIFNIVILALSSDDLCLKINASLCLPIFFHLPQTHVKLQQHLGLILNALVHNPLHLEQVSETLENVIDTFDISDFAIDISRKMIDAVDLDNIDTTSYLRIISGLFLVLSDKKDVVLKIYECSLPIIYQIVNYKAYDFFIEAIDIVSNVLYVFKTGDQNISTLVGAFLNSDHKELINCSEEMTYLLDNYISYCNIEHFEQIFQFITLLCYQKDDYLFEDDFIAGCRIIESLILNGKYRTDRNHLNFFTKIVFDNYSKLENNGLLYGLEIIANAFNVDYCSGRTEVYNIIKQDINRYIKDMNENRKRFKRVHDKKIGLLFCANLMSTSESIDINIFLSFFTHLLFSFDQAESLRNSLKNKTDVDLEDDTEYDESDEYLEEDVYFCTPLDNVDIKMVLKNTFSNLKPEMLGNRILQAMNTTERQRVSDIVEGINIS